MQLENAHLNNALKKMKLDWMKLLCSYKTERKFDHYSRRTVNMKDAITFRRENWLWENYLYFEIIEL